MLFPTVRAPGETWIDARSTQTVMGGGGIHAEGSASPGSGRTRASHVAVVNNRAAKIASTIHSKYEPSAQTFRPVGSRGGMDRVVVCSRSRGGRQLGYPPRRQDPPECSRRSGRSFALPLRAVRTVVCTRVRRPNRPVHGEGTVVLAMQVKRFL